MKIRINEFYRFLWIFFKYFQIFKSLKKIAKKGLISRDRRESDVARREHVAEPREPTWTHVDAYVARWDNWAGVWWAHGILGPY